MTVEELIRELGNENPAAIVHVQVGREHAPMGDVWTVGPYRVVIAAEDADLTGVDATSLDDPVSALIAARELSARMADMGHHSESGTPEYAALRDYARKIGEAL
jgi:hypothetical protein